MANTTQWILAATITYRDGSWKGVEAVSDESGFRMVQGTEADLVDVSYDPTFQQMLVYMGFPQSTGSPSPDVTDVVYRFHFQTTNHNINVIGSTNHVFLTNASTPAQIAELHNAIQADQNFQVVIQATVGPARITHSPTNVTVTEGATATFSVTATSNGQVTYQWYRNLILISGATSRNYTTPVTTLADDGTNFFVKVTNSAGTATSDTAILTVNPLVPTTPQIILTISGLAGGETFLGLGNGVHTVDPTIYNTTPSETWTASLGYPTVYDRLAIGAPATSVGPTSSVGFQMRDISSSNVQMDIAFYTSNYTVRFTSLLTYYHFYGSIGVPTIRIKNRQFGTLTTNKGVTISWQRAPNWPTNPPTASYTITASTGANGVVTPTGASVVNLHGSRLYTITPAIGYTVNNVLVDGVPQGPITSYNFSNVAANHTIAATFVLDPVPQMLLTISGLLAGENFLGLWNGIHAVQPTTYQASPEHWSKSFYPTTLTTAQRLQISNRTTVTYVQLYDPTGPIPPSPPYLMVNLNSLSISLISSNDISSYSFPFVPATLTTKVKNRAFGTLTTTGGVTISWQRASNWPSNP